MMMDEMGTQRLIYSACFLALNYLVFLLCKRSAKQTQRNHGMRLSRYFAIRKALRMISLGVAVVGSILIWGLSSFRHVWMAVSSAVAVIAFPFYTVLREEGSNLISVPNSLYFQKYIRVTARGRKAGAASPGSL